MAGNIGNLTIVESIISYACDIGTKSEGACQFCATGECCFIDI